MNSFSHLVFNLFGCYFLIFSLMRYVSSNELWVFDSMSAIKCDGHYRKQWTYENWNNANSLIATMEAIKFTKCDFATWTVSALAPHIYTCIHVHGIEQHVRIELCAKKAYWRLNCIFLCESRDPGININFK